MGDWNLEAFAKFWEMIEYDTAMQYKLQDVYYPDVDWDHQDDELWDEDYEEDDYGDYF